jgi:hypothetical protein
VAVYDGVIPIDVAVIVVLPLVKATILPAVVIEATAEAELVKVT